MTPKTIAAAAMISLATAGTSMASQLAPGAAHSIRLSGFDGIVYHTVGQDGYRVVATLAAGPDAMPIRFVATLTPGQRMLVSLPRAAGQPAVDFEIVRTGDALLVDDTVSAAVAELANEEEVTLAP